MTTRELKKIIAFDLDGTLAESKQELSNEMANLLYSLSLKTKVAIISGGSYRQFQKQIIPKLIEASGGASLHNILFLPTSGTSRYEYDEKIKDWREVYTHVFAGSVKTRVINELNDILGEHKSDFEIPEKHYGTYIEDRGNQITLSAMGQEAPLDEKSTWDPTGSKRLRIKTDLEKVVPEIEANLGGTTSVDVLPKGFDKSFGLKVTLDALKLSVKDILFVGDAVFEGGNDYSPSLVGIETIGVKNPTETALLISTFL